MKVHEGDYENFDEEELHPEIEINLDRMNEASNSINRLERQLSTEESRHKKFVIDFADKLEKSKKNLSEKEIKNSEQFYLIMRRESTLKSALSKAKHEFDLAAEMVQLIEQGIRNAETVNYINNEKRIVKAEVKNKQIAKLNDALRKRDMAEQNYHDIDLQHHQLLRLAEKESKAHPWNIRASRSYYEVKLNGEAEVIQISKRIDKLKSEIVVLKSSYRQAMVNLDAISTQIHDLRSTSSCISEESCISDDAERYCGDGAYAENDFTENTGTFVNKIKDLSVQLDAKQQKNLAKKDLEELDRQNAQFDQTNDTDQIAIVARLAADGAER